MVSMIATGPSKPTLGNNRIGYETSFKLLKRQPVKLDPGIRAKNPKESQTFAQIV